MKENNFFIKDENLPDFLPDSQLYELLNKAKKDDEDAIKIVAEHNIKLVLMIVNKNFKTVEWDKNELISIGNIGLLKAIQSFDKEKNVQFSTYASKCINNEILMFLRKLKKYKNVDSLDRPIYNSIDGYNNIKLEDTITDGTDIEADYDKLVTYEIVREVVTNLPPRDKKIITLYFGFDDNIPHNQYEIADILSVSQSYISKSMTKILAEIEKKLAKKGIEEINFKKQEKLDENKHDFDIKKLDDNENEFDTKKLENLDDTKNNFETGKLK